MSFCIGNIYNACNPPPGWTMECYGMNCNSRPFYYQSGSSGGPCAMNYSWIPPQCCQPGYFKETAINAVLNNPDIQNLTLCSCQAISLYDLKNSCKNAYYGQLQNDLAQCSFGAFINNSYGSATPRLQEMQSLASNNPSAYYNALLGLYGKQMGWEAGQNTSCRNAGTIAAITAMVPCAEKAGLSACQINSLVGQGYSAASAQNQNRIANAAGGCGFFNGIQNLATPVLDVAAVASGNPELIPLINGAVSVANGASPIKAIENAGISYATQGLMGGLSSLAGTPMCACAVALGGSGGGSSFVPTAGNSFFPCTTNFGNSGMTCGMVNGGVTGNNYDANGNLISTCNPAPPAATWNQAFGGTGCACLSNQAYGSAASGSCSGGLSSVAKALASKIASGALSSAVGSALGSTGSSNSSSSGASCSASSGALNSVSNTCCAKQKVGALQADQLSAAPVYATNQAKLAQLKQIYPQIGGTGSSGQTSLSASPVQSFEQTIAQAAPTPQNAAASNPYSSLYQTLFDTPLTPSAIPVAAQGGGTSDIVDRFEKKNPPLPQYAKDGHVPEFVTGATGHYVKGKGTGQSDDIPAMLADGEYVLDADSVAQLGDGSSDAGAKLLDHFREALREHKRSAPKDQIPPKASPLVYMKEALKKHSKG